jgi:hypothetical protein
VLAGGTVLALFYGKLLWWFFLQISVSFAAHQTEDGGADTVASDVTEEPEEQQHCLSDDQ